MVRRGLSPSREAARAAIEAGRVVVGGAPAVKASRAVAAAESVRVLGPPPRFVGRGGDKLDAALDGFALDVTGRTALDAGASTGGFTDCLLQRGAARVHAVDVGHGQLHPSLRADPRVDVRERTNVRDLEPGDFPTAPDLLVVDLSFVGLASVAPALFGVVAPGADGVVLVKPQFEAGRAEASRGKGVIRDPVVWLRVLVEVGGALAAGGATIMEGMVSPRRGASGNVEFLLRLQAPTRSGRGHVTVDFGRLVADVGSTGPEPG